MIHLLYIFKQVFGFCFYYVNLHIVQAYLQFQGIEYTFEYSVFFKYSFALSYV